MPEERPVVIDPVLTQLSKLESQLSAFAGEIRTEIKELRQEVQTFRRETHGRLSRLEGGFEQMDKRVGYIERAISQIQWSLVSGFLVTIVAVLLAQLL